MNTSGLSGMKKTAFSKESMTGICHETVPDIIPYPHNTLNRGYPDRSGKSDNTFNPIQGRRHEKTGSREPHAIRFPVTHAFRQSLAGRNTGYLPHPFTDNGSDPGRNQPAQDNDLPGRASPVFSVPRKSERYSRAKHRSGMDHLRRNPALVAFRHCRPSCAYPVMPHAASTA